MKLRHQTAIAAIVLSAIGQGFAQETLPGAPGGQPVDLERGQGPGKIVVPERPRPVPRPTRNQQVAVLSISLSFERGEVTAAKVTSSKRISSFAPKVFARQGGDWQVVINGEIERAFYVNNPGLREAEAHPSSRDRYEWVGETSVIDWPLVIPLYADGRSLGARSVTIVDVATKRVILETAI